MIKYAIILLDRTSTTFCYADNPFQERQLIPIATLEEVILWCMKENLRIQFVYPDYEIPQTHLTAINSIDHTDIKHLNEADVTVYNRWEEVNVNNISSPSIVVRSTTYDLIDNHDILKSLLKFNGHVSIVLTDVERIKDDNIEKYRQLLNELTPEVETLAVNSTIPQISILTDRLFLSTMNNCNAGFESITIGPNGKFYICPAFYYENSDDSVGDLQSGLEIKNQQLFKLDHAPICRECDAFHCRRCIWLNRKTTLEVNTPSHEQCVVSHIERNASRQLLHDIRKHGEFLPSTNIEEIDYLDPFDKIINKNTI